MERGQPVLIKSTGKKELYISKEKDYIRTTVGLSQYASTGHPEEDVEALPPVDHSKRSFEIEEFLPIFYGWKLVPNFEEIEDLSHAVSLLTLGGAGPSESYVGRAATPKNYQGEWARYFLHKGQFKGFNGQ